MGRINRCLIKCDSISSVGNRLQRHLAHQELQFVQFYIHTNATHTHLMRLNVNEVYYSSKHILLVDARVEEQAVENVFLKYQPPLQKIRYAGCAYFYRKGAEIINEADD